MTQILSARVLAESTGLTVHGEQALPAQGLVRNLLDSSLILAEDWERLSAQTRVELSNCSDTQTVLPLLVKHSLLTDYQAARVEAGTTFGLLLGNYRVLERLGAGGMGVVFKGEHVRLRRQVAIKVLAHTSDLDGRLLE